MTLADFLLARIAEDEASVRADVVGREWPNPRRALAECEAKRRIVEIVQRWLDTGYPTLDHVLFALALPFADHPDYRDEWKP